MEIDSSHKCRFQAFKSLLKLLLSCSPKLVRRNLFLL